MVLFFFHPTFIQGSRVYLVARRCRWSHKDAGDGTGEINDDANNHGSGSNHDGVGEITNIMLTVVTLRGSLTDDEQ